MPMPAGDTELRSERVDQIVALLRGKLAADQGALLEVFAREYFGQVDPEDLDDRELPDLYGAVLSHWNIARRREPGQMRVRAFNPTVAEHGWQSTHTIIEIVNDDMPFLVDSVTMEVNRHGLTLHLIIHPVLTVKRAKDGTLTGLADASDKAALRESFIHVEVDRVPEASGLEALSADITRVLGDVRLAVADWPAMRDRVRAIVDGLSTQKLPIPAAELDEGRAFLAWLADNHFTLLGSRSHDLVVQDGEDVLRIVPDSSLGILRETGEAHAKVVASGFAALPPEVRAYARRPELLVVTKSTARSTVHRPGYLDYIAVKRFGADGEVIGEDRFLGLFTSTAYSASPSQIPLLRRKIANVVARAGLPAGGHTGKALINILETYPRDELFQTSEENLLRTAIGILHLDERQRFRLFIRRDPFERFLSCLIYAPRENYTTELREKWQAILVKAFNGTNSEFNVHLTESVLARIQIVVRTRPGQIPEYDAREIEERLVASARRWDDDLKAALIEAAGEARGNALLRRFGAAFPVSYRSDFSARAAVPDIELMAALSDAEPVAMTLYRPLEAAPGALRFKLLRLATPLTLSGSLPMLEHMGLKVLDEHPYRISMEDGTPIWIHDFGLDSGLGDADIEIDTLRPVFEEAFGAILGGEVENDDFNRLVVSARLPAREIVVLRAYAKYMRQIGFALSQSFIQATLAAHPAIARSLVLLFKARFDPDAREGSEARASAEVAAIDAALEDVDNLSEDRVLRQYVGLILATTRTNYWRRDAAGARRSFVSFKFDSSKVPGLPEPKPMFEIFVHSTRFEGVHLRGGRVARGGLRWSDRREDFRTEVLGLVKAQMVKNTIIVPVGSKGGFVLKKAPPSSDREAFVAEGVACYKDYLRGLLDITDNRVGTEVAPPPQVVRHDDDDPYLVVAADKGTASFSDYANGISKEYDFWLGDAFASGGSVGYDHKAMGITARGAWESAKRHFRELGVDTQTTDFTVAGVGDMSGDVFGNGMLLSRHIRLVAAFDHRHVFLDPNPDAARSFAERERLFKLPRSSWADYDASLISAGGGVHPRSAKSIALTPEVKAALGIEVNALTPTELVNAILKAPVDLIYNGGIGTYVKSSDESHAEVGDRANDVLRVDGRELRCKVFVEGGNLGCTQLGRIEYALAGGRINTDAIDNSAGVDTSDHEVNIKILLGLPIAEGEMTEKQRNALLPEMTDEVATLVLRDNVFQTQVLSVTGRIAPQMLDAQTRFMQFLEKAGRLNRAIEYLPTDEQIAERRAEGLGLTTPERAVLLAYSKIWLYDELLASPLPDDPRLAVTLTRYFPKRLREGFTQWMPRHPLGREIIATYVTNSMLNRVGSTYVYRLVESTGARAHEVVRAYLMSRDIFGLVPMWHAIEELDNQVPDEVQSRMLIHTSAQLERGTTWLLRSRRLTDDMAHTVAYFQPGVEALSARLRERHDADANAAVEAVVQHYEVEGVPRDLAVSVATFDSLHAMLDIAEVAADAGEPVELVAEVHFDIGNRLGLPWLRDKIGALPGDQHWRNLAKVAMQDDLSGLQRAITVAILACAGAGTPAAERMAAWQQDNGRALERAGKLVAELRALPVPDSAMLSVTLRELRALG
ncbi:MAG: NAD-glutamate dehydrogenase [Burkholderiales bacterium]